MPWCTRQQVEEARNALWGRHDWIVDRVAHINDLRRYVYTRGYLDREDPHIARGVEQSLSEEGDPHDESDVRLAAGMLLLYI